MSPFYPGFQGKPRARISERFQRYFLEICLSIFGCKRQSYDLDNKVMTARKTFMPQGQEITLSSRLSRRRVERLVMWRFVEFPLLTFACGQPGASPPQCIRAAFLLAATE